MAPMPTIKVPARTLVPLPDELSFATGAAISCGTGTAYQALRRMNVSGRDTLAVFGQGPVGLSATQLGTAMGTRIIALDTSAERRTLAKEMGAETVIDPAADDAVAALKELTHGQGVDLALDCSGAEAARAAAIRATRTWGTVCFVGEGGSVTIDVSRDMIKAAHGDRLVDLLERDPGGVRALRRRSRNRRRARVHAALRSIRRPTPTGCSTPEHRQGVFLL